MRVNCPKCGQAIPGADINVFARTAVCRPCSEVFDLTLPNVDLSHAKLYKPDNLRWTELPSAGRVTVIVSSAWPTRWQGVRMAMFAGPWNAFSGMIWVAIFTHGALRAPIPLLLIAGLLGLAGVVFIYLALANLFNRTRITVDRDRLDVVRAPLREVGELHRATSEVERFVVVEQARGSSLPFVVMVQTRGGILHATRIAFTDRAHADYAADRLAQLVDDARTAAADRSTYRGVRVETESIDGEADAVAPEEPERSARRA
jgi:hypothetical protein